MTLDSGTMIIPSGRSGSGSSGTSWGALSSKTISGGEISVSGSGSYELSPETGTTDNLDTINGGSVGDVIRLFSSSDSYAITVKHGTGNIRIGYDFSLDNSFDMIELMKKSDGNWVGGGLNDNA